MIAFAKSKIQAPLPPATAVLRPSLQSRLQQALEARTLVLLAAPAGYGKTTLLAQALRALPPVVASVWMRVEPTDDLHRFCTCLAAALDAYDVPWRVAPEAMAGLAEHPNGLREMARQLSAALTATELQHGVVVLDDLHTVSDPRLFKLLDVLLQHWPERWTLVMVTRTDPPVSLARLWAQGQMEEFRQTDLRLTLEEATAMLAQAGAEADRAGELAQRMLRETGGWPAGLRLYLLPQGADRAALARRGRRHLFEYLASEVMTDLPPQLKRFLMRSSVLDELTPTRCMALTGDPRTAEWLDEVERRGLFATALDSEEITLRLHDLFRSYLEDMLLNEAPEEVPSLLRRAASDEPDLARKVQLLLRAGDAEAAENVVGDAYVIGLALGDEQQLMRLFEQFPEDRRQRSAVFAMLRGLAAWPGLECSIAWPLLHQAAEGFERRAQTRQAQRARAYEAVALHLLGQVDAALALAARIESELEDRVSAERESRALIEVLHYQHALAFGPAQAPARHLNRLVDVLAGGASAELWYRCVMGVFFFVSRPGHSEALRRFVAGAMAAAGEAHEPLLVVSRALLAGALLMEGELQAARDHIVRAQDDYAWLGSPPIAHRLPVLLGVTHVVTGQWASARAVCEQWVARARARPEPRSALLYGSVEFAGRLATAVGAWDVATEALEFLQEIAQLAEGPCVRLPRDALRARLLLHEGRAEDAAHLLEPIVATSSDLDRLGHDAFARACLAAACWRRGDAGAAWSALAPWLQRASATREVLSLALLGEELLEELRALPFDEARADPSLLAVLRRGFDVAAEWLRPARSQTPAAGSAAAPPVLQAGGTDSALAVQPSAEAQAAPGETLTARELQVLEYLVAGDSNKLIARKLDLSPHTVKRHVARILMRLNLNSRGQAAHWYREHMPPPTGR
jgi:LuxR family maltose regulon positive regulatory protein